MRLWSALLITKFCWVLLDIWHENLVIKCWFYNKHCTFEYMTVTFFLVTSLPFWRPLPPILASPIKMDVLDPPLLSPDEFWYSLDCLFQFRPFETSLEFLSKCNRLYVLLYRLNKILCTRHCWAIVCKELLILFTTRITFAVVLLLYYVLKVVYLLLMHHLSWAVWTLLLFQLKIIKYLINRHIHRSSAYQYVVSSLARSLYVDIITV